MTLLAQLVSGHAVPTEPMGRTPTKRRGRWRRSTKREREAADRQLAAELRARRAATAARMAQEQTALLAKSSKLPPGIAVVGQQEDA
jgi:hypothetical protein